MSLQTLCIEKSHDALPCTYDSSFQDGSGAGLMPAVDDAVREAALRAGFFGEQLAFLEQVYWYIENTYRRAGRQQ